MQHEAEIRSGKNMALKLIRDSAVDSSLAGEGWKEKRGSLVNPETTLFLINEVERLQNLVKVLSQGQGDYSRGYTHGFEDATNQFPENEEEMAWAIVDRRTEKVSFETIKPVKLTPSQVAIPLFARS